jgi:hypothetical protein
MKFCSFRGAFRLLVAAVAGAAGFAAPASIGLAQDNQGAKHESGAAASKPPHTVSGVVVQAPPKPNKIPPHKRAAFDAEAANRNAWTSYRASASAPTGKQVIGASPQTGDYPGLNKLGSH